MLHGQTATKLEKRLTISLHQFIQNRAPSRVGDGSVEVIHETTRQIIGKFTLACQAKERVDQLRGVSARAELASRRRVHGELSAELLFSRGAVFSRMAHRAFVEGDLRKAILESRVAVVDARSMLRSDRVHGRLPRIKNDGAGAETRTRTSVGSGDFKSPALTAQSMADAPGFREGQVSIRVSITLGL